MMLRLWDAIVFRLTGRRRNRGTTPVYPQWAMQPGTWQIPSDPWESELPS